MNPNIKRTGEMVQLERAVIKMIWDDVKNTKDDGVWRKYERGFTFEGSKYKVKCSFRISNQYLTYRNMLIHHATETIYVPQSLELH